MPGLPEFLSGETVFLSTRFSGYQVGGKDNVELEWTVEAFDDAKVPLIKADKKKVEAELALEDKDWKPKVRAQFETPNTASCAKCTLKITVTDKLNGATVSSELPFSIRGKAVEPSESLVIRNFRFLRTEEDGPALQSPSYRSGDELWGRFDITGFRHGKDNRIQVEYGLSVFRPSGNLLYEEKKAASFDESSFYPKRYVEGILNLKLQGLSAGEYPLVLEVRDLEGNQKLELRQTFRVE